MSYYSRRGYGWGGFPPYVTTYELEARAAQVASRIAQREKRELHGIHLTGRTIAKTFWGKAWCENIESYRDYAYRLERGRRYVRSGSVIDLAIAKGRIQALVCGSESRPYTVSISIRPMPRAKWDELVKRMTGRISSLMALAGGQLPKELLEDFCNAETGLFPKPGEIKLSCSCPDSATCCKHVAAVLYGVGARLDDNPELFFTLRGVDPQSIVSAEKVVDSLTAESSSELGSSDLGDVFGISLDSEAAPVQAAAASRRNRAKGAASRRDQAKGDSCRKSVKEDADFAALFKSTRARLHLTQAALATRLHTNQTTISVIERGGKCSRAAQLADAIRVLEEQGRHI